MKKHKAAAEERCATFCPLIVTVEGIVHQSSPLKNDPYTMNYGKQQDLTVPARPTEEEEDLYLSYEWL